MRCSPCGRSHERHPHPPPGRQSFPRLLLLALDLVGTDASQSVGGNTEGLGRTPLFDQSLLKADWPFDTIPWAP